VASGGIELKFLSERDRHILDRVAEEVFDHPIRETLATQSLQDPNNLLVVAVVEDTVVGMAAATRMARPDKPPQLYIDEVAVTPAHRRKAIASELVLALLERGRALGCSAAWLATEQDNEAARALYRSLQAEEETMPAVVYAWTFDATEP
jgi:aminoglycoside 6'-N-acetyltransferase I